MLLGLISDTHDNAAATSRACDVFRARGILDVIHCGDITTASTLELFAGFRLRACLGNNDSLAGLEAAAARLGGSIAGTLDIGIGGKRLFVAHGHRPGGLLEAVRSGEYDYVFYGHAHRPDDRREGTTRLINPGALHRAAVWTIAILDLAADALEFIEISKQAPSG